VGVAVTEPEQAPGAEFLMPPQMPPGEVSPPMGLQPMAGLTTPDAKGRVWVVLQLTDGTVTNQFRVPWRVAGQLGQAIAEQLVQAAAKARALSGPQLWTPDQMPPGMPPPGSVNGRRLG
jgi:hypothetical protein